MFDMHVHLLPGLDDGCATMDETIALARYLASEGITHAVATVHHLPGVYDVPPGAVEVTLRAVREALAAESISCEVSAANEIMIHRGLAERAKAGELLGIDAALRYALVELPLHELPWFALTTLEHMTELGITPVVAHPERCYPLHGDPSELRSWFAKGILAQLDLASLVGMHGTRVRRFAEFLVRNHLVHLLGSDLHGPPARADLWQRACRRIARLGGETYLRIVAEDLPRHILAGTDISRLVPPPRQVKRFSLSGLAGSVLGHSPRS